ncbi:MAG TPA: prepilin-type N-terminal cleavage/methylation domain-containing protein [Candidatus Saccharimonadia bacterium]|nr:prepilin-type N-terminal cleavage/methylation domain-containing protein [Candidatus Saccharimonadia bacterium]
MGYSKGLGRLRTRQREVGFTLVELLLALFLFALIAGVIFAAFAAVASGVEKGRQSIEIYRVGRVALLRMAQEVGAAMPPPAGSDTRFQGKKNADGGTGHDRIDFLTIPYRRYSDKVPSYELCRVAYYVTDNPQGKTALFREEDCSGDEDERREHATRLELTDLAVGLEITYYDVEKDYEEWPPNRDDQSLLPCRVRLALTLRDALQYARAFITTVALPMRGACEDAQTRRTQTQSNVRPASGR